MSVDALEMAATFFPSADTSLTSLSAYWGDVQVPVPAVLSHNSCPPVSIGAEHKPQPVVIKHKHGTFSCENDGRHAKVELFSNQDSNVEEVYFHEGSPVAVGGSEQKNHVVTITTTTKKQQNLVNPGPRVVLATSAGGTTAGGGGSSCIFIPITDGNPQHISDHHLLNITNNTAATQLCNGLQNSQQHLNNFIPQNGTSFIMERPPMQQKRVEGSDSMLWNQNGLVNNNGLLNNSQNRMVEATALFPPMLESQHHQFLNNHNNDSSGVCPPFILSHSHSGSGGVFFDGADFGCNAVAGGSGVVAGGSDVISGAISGGSGISSSGGGILVPPHPRQQQLPPFYNNNRSLVVGIPQQQNSLRTTSSYNKSSVPSSRRDYQKSDSRKSDSKKSDSKLSNSRKSDSKNSDCSKMTNSRKSDSSKKSPSSSNSSQGGKQLIDMTNVGLSPIGSTTAQQFNPTTSTLYVPLAPSSKSSSNDNAKTKKKSPVSSTTTKSPVSSTTTTRPTLTPPVSWLEPLVEKKLSSSTVKSGSWSVPNGAASSSYEPSQAQQRDTTSSSEVVYMPQDCSSSLEEEASSEMDSPYHPSQNSAAAQYQYGGGGGDAMNMNMNVNMNMNRLIMGDSSSYYVGGPGHSYYNNNNNACFSQYGHEPHYSAADGEYGNKDQLPPVPHQDRYAKHYAISTESSHNRDAVTGVEYKMPAKSSTSSLMGKKTMSMSALPTVAMSPCSNRKSPSAAKRNVFEQKPIVSAARPYSSSSAGPFMRKDTPPIQETPDNNIKELPHFGGYAEGNHSSPSHTSTAVKRNVSSPTIIKKPLIVRGTIAAVAPATSIRKRIPHGTQQPRDPSVRGDLTRVGHHNKPSAALFQSASASALSGSRPRFHNPQKFHQSPLRVPHGNEANQTALLRTLSSASTLQGSGRDGGDVILIQPSKYYYDSSDNDEDTQKGRKGSGSASFSPPEYIEPEVDISELYWALEESNLFTPAMLDKFTYEAEGAIRDNDRCAASAGYYLRNRQPSLRRGGAGDRQVEVAMKRYRDVAMQQTTQSSSSGGGEVGCRTTMHAEQPCYRSPSGKIVYTPATDASYFPRMTIKGGNPDRKWKPSSSSANSSTMNLTSSTRASSRHLTRSLSPGVSGTIEASKVPQHTRHFHMPEKASLERSPAGVIFRPLSQPNSCSCTSKQSAQTVPRFLPQWTGGQSRVTPGIPEGHIINGKGELVPHWRITGPVPQWYWGPDQRRANRPPQLNLKIRPATAIGVINTTTAAANTKKNGRQPHPYTTETQNQFVEEEEDDEENEENYADSNPRMPR